MDKILVESINLIAIVSVFIFLFLKPQKLVFAAITVITLQVLLSVTVAYHTFSNGLIEIFYDGSFITGVIPVKIDYLSAWFIIVISFTFITGSLYGIHYLKKYKEQSSNLKMHSIFYILTYTALVDICIIQNGIVFLVVWEIMAFGSFILIIFEHYKKETLKAGINFLIQSHISILFLTIAFLWAKVKTGSFDFAAITAYTAVHPKMAIGLFLLFFIGFSIKAGFVPFHTWLPHAHPVAPSHISGVMSGVIIKIGVFGIFRMLMVINLNFTIVGFFIILISIITGLYGVMMTVIQNNLKKLLAYCSIENIGIIGIGIGLGCLGKGTNHPSLIFAGFGGALLHVLNHSLFKSLLFYNAGNVYLATHSLNINSLGGLLKSIPKTGYLFLIGALAICGLPPFNGFISEYFIYRGLFDGINSNQSLSNLFLLFSIFALVLMGGLALIAFTKSFGIIFLGKGRDKLPVDKTIDGALGIIPQCIIIVAILLIGLFPFLLSPILIKTTSLFNNPQDIVSSQYIGDFLGDVKEIGLFSLSGIILVVCFLYLRRFLTKKHSKNSEETWGCAYVAPIPRAQYSGSSYSRTFEMLFNFIVKGRKSNENIPKEQLYPEHYTFSTINDDFWEKYIITPPLKWFSFLLNKFKFIQNGKIQSYVIYGLTFIVVVLIVGNSKTLQYF